jgi:hypothetical protein
VALKHYNRAGALEASRRHAAYIDAAEDAAARMLGQAPANLHKQKPVRSLHDLTPPVQVIGAKAGRSACPNLRI